MISAFKKLINKDEPLTPIEIRYFVITINQCVYLILRDLSNKRYKKPFSHDTYLSYTCNIDNEKNEMKNKIVYQLSKMLVLVASM